MVGVRAERQPRTLNGQIGFERPREAGARNLLEQLIRPLEVIKGLRALTQLAFNLSTLEKGLCLHTRRAPELHRRDHGILEMQGGLWQVCDQQRPNSSAVHAMGQFAILRS